MRFEGFGSAGNPIIIGLEVKLLNAEYRAYLENGVDRTGTHCLKWDDRKNTFGREDVLPMWVADMDFPTLPAICQALAKRTEHPVFGYTFVTPEEKRAELGWLERRHGVKAEEDWILYCDGVVDSLFACARAFARPGSQIMVQPPVYGPFYQAAKVNGFGLWRNGLRQTEDGWHMDLENMEQGFRSGVSMFLLCNPHNPVGRVWTREELLQVTELADRYGVTIVSDEIHSDFIYAPHRLNSILSLPHPERRIMLHSATKTFNLAALRQSSLLAPGEEKRALLRTELEKMHAGTPNLFGALAQRVAYEQGDEWLDELLRYLQENRDWLKDALSRRLPQIRMSDLEGTYLAWLDFRAFQMDQETLSEKLIRETGLGLSSGLQFGEEGNGFFRMNLATQRKNVEEAVDRLAKTFG